MNLCHPPTTADWPSPICDMQSARDALGGSDPHRIEIQAPWPEEDEMFVYRRIGTGP